MENTVLTVNGMSCEHCVKAIKNAVEKLHGVVSVNVALSNKTVTIFHDKSLASIDKIKTEIEEQGFKVIS